MKFHEYHVDADLVIYLMHRVSAKEIEEVMREYAEGQGEPNGHFTCGDCNCGYNLGEDGDCFACMEHENLFMLKWVPDEEAVSE